MEKQLALHLVLTEIIGTSRAYFQAPKNLTMEYPCLRYEFDDVDTVHADNAPYIVTKKWALTYITRDANDPVVDKLLALRSAVMERRYAADGLYHNMININF